MDVNLYLCETLKWFVSPWDLPSFPRSWCHSSGLAACTRRWCHKWQPHFVYDWLMAGSGRSSLAPAFHLLANHNPEGEGPDWSSDLRDNRHTELRKTLLEWACACMCVCVSTFALRLLQRYVVSIPRPPTDSQPNQRQSIPVSYWKTIDPMELLVSCRCIENTCMDVESTLCPTFNILAK